MTADATITNTTGTGVGEPVQITAHHRNRHESGLLDRVTPLRRPGFKRVVMLDLLSARIETGDIQIRLDIDRATVKLLVPDSAKIDGDDLRRVGRGRVKDWTGTSVPGGRRTQIFGEMRNAEVRVDRGGVAIVSLLCSPKHRRAVRLTCKEGRLDYLLGVHGQAQKGCLPMPEGGRR